MSESQRLKEALAFVMERMEREARDAGKPFTEELPIEIEVPRDAPRLAMLGQSPVSNVAVYNCPHLWR